MKDVTKLINGLENWTLSITEDGHKLTYDNCGVPINFFIKGRNKELFFMELIKFERDYNVSTEVYQRLNSRGYGESGQTMKEMLNIVSNAKKRIEGFGFFNRKNKRRTTILHSRERKWMVCS